MSQKRQHSLSERRLAAIMFTDIVGYTALMGEDEEKAFTLLDKNRQIQKPIIEKYGGKWLKEMGDGVLASFSTVSDAVYCAASIQLASKEEPDLKLRIGIHQGEVVFDSDDVFGDGVNIASRLESLAPEGGIWVSESVSRNIQNKQGIETQFIREEQLKNVNDPVRIYEVNVIGEIPLVDDPVFQPGRQTFDKEETSTERKGSGKKFLIVVVGFIVILALAYFLYRSYSREYQIVQTTDQEVMDKSIAVLPFKSLSEDPEKQYLADGVRDAILLHLSKIEDLRVITRTSVEKYRNPTQTISEIADDLKVNFILEGRFQKYGDQAKLIVQLSNAEEKEDHIWAEEYDRDWSDIFSVQSEVAKKVAEALEAELNPLELMTLEPVPAVDPRAYEYYLKGKSLPFSNEGVYKAMEYYNQAIELSPNFSLAYTGLGYCYWYLAHYSGAKPAPFWTESLKTLEKAIEVDSLNGEAYSELGVVKHSWEWDLEGARQAFEQAIMLAPNNATVHYDYGWFLLTTGNFDAARREHQILQELRLERIWFTIPLLLGEGEYGEASLLASKWNPGSSGWDNFYIGMAFLATEQLENGIASLEQSVSESGTTLDPLALLGYAYGVAGEYNRADSIREQLMTASAVRYIPSMYFTWIYVGLKEYELVFQYLDKSFDEHDFRLHWMIYMPLFDPIKSDPRFADILNRSWNGQLNYIPKSSSR